MRRFNRFLERLLHCGTAVSSILFFIVVLVAVLTRYILRTPILASIELSRLFFVWSCFLAAALTYRRRAHIGITLLFGKLPIALRRFFALFIHLAIMLFLAMILVQSVLVNRLLWPTDLPMLGISQAYFYLPLPIVSLFMIAFTVEFLVVDWIAVKAGESS